MLAEARGHLCVVRINLLKDTLQHAARQRPQWTLELPLEHPGASLMAPPTVSQTLTLAVSARGGSAAWVSLSRLIRQRHANAYELRPASVTTKADTARRKASERQAFVATTYASKRAQVGFSREKGLFKRTPATLPLLTNHRPLHSTHSL